jgi:hypothetical protein
MTQLKLDSFIYDTKYADSITDENRTLAAAITP